MNAVGGGVYVLEWDPANGYILSWVFPRGQIPTNLQDSIDTASSAERGQEQLCACPDPSTWDCPMRMLRLEKGQDV